MPKGVHGSRGPCCEASPSVNIRHLRHQQLLSPGCSFTCSWTSPLGQPLGRVDVSVGSDELLLEWKGGSQRLPITWTAVRSLPPPYQGSRPWFLCPHRGADGEVCGRRCEALYRNEDNSDFICRECRHLIYACQSESASQQAVRRARKARLRLGGSANLFEPFPVRPPWRYRAVYARWLAQAQRATEACWGLQQPGRPAQGRDARGRYLPIAVPKP